jgi:Leucine-rich repeat (LRR) protein
MAKKQEPKIRFEKLAQTLPVLPVISDHPLDKENAFDDRFDLCLRLGPVFDIIRHSKTPTPTAIAIYGDWGTGKTSSMKWLEGLINEWNENGIADDKTTIRTVWFYPWKYHDKDDVWRGLISEVILKGTEIKGANIERVTKAAKQFGLFLGKGFIHTLASLKLKLGDAKTTGEAGFDLSCIKDILGEYDKNIHPEKAFLNDFENSFEQWLKGTLGPNERMVIFIDDLDRCMPQVALGVLEALKLYLNIKQLIFVVGVDKNVIDPLVKKHYKDLGLEEYKSGNYLAKMFQTEVTVGPSEDQVVEYLDYHLANVDYFNTPYLEKEEKELFRGLINNLADRNPREVKRLINSAVMSGAGVEMLKKAGDDQSGYSFKQGLQVFFIRKILEGKKYDMPRLLGSIPGNSFFGEWSQIVCDNIKKDKDFPLTITVPEDYQQILLKYKDISEGSFDEVSEQMNKRALAESPPDIPMAYYKFIKTPAYSDFLPLLSDKRLGQLMQIEFSAEIAKKTQEAEPVKKLQDDEKTVDYAIRKSINKETGALDKADYANIPDLDLSDKGLTALPAKIIRKLTAMEELNLTGNQLTTLPEAIGELVALKWLNLDGNQLTTLPEDIGELVALELLSLTGNQLTTLPEAIWKLTAMEGLYLIGNQLTILPEAIGELVALKRLYLNGNQLTTLPEAMGNLTNLQMLYLMNNKLTALPEALGSLTNLQELYLMDNQLTALPEAMGKLTNLQELYLNNNQFTALPEALGKLTNLQKLDLSNNQFTALPEALGKLTNLQKLDLSNNQFTALPEALGKLTNLQSLNLKDNQFSDEEKDRIKSSVPDNCTIRF